MWDIDPLPAPENLISALRSGERQVSGEEGQHLRLHPQRHPIRVVAIVELESIGDAVLSQYLAQLPVVAGETILVADIYTDGM
jgi:hypothetical protein